MNTAAMSSLMRPRSIAILGPSTDPAKFSHRPLVYLRELGFSGPVYPVHPQASEIAGFRCYRSIEELPGPVDVAVIARPAAHVPAEIEQCIARGIRAFVVFSAGFAEAGAEGAVLQQRVVQLCADAGAVLCGPNGTGVIDVPSGAALSFMSNLDNEVAPGGSVALVSGSGSIAAMLFQGNGRLFRSVASIGNEAVTTSAEFIADAVEQPGTSGVIVVLEAIRDPARLMTALRRADELGTPVAVLKGGRSARAAEVAATHTGALVDDDMATQAMFDHCNAIRASSIDQLKLLAALMHASGNRTLGPNVGVLTPSGGTAVLIVDELAENGLELPALDASTCAALKSLVPESTPGNPMDITGFGANSKEIFSSAMAMMLDDPAVDVLLVPMGGGVGKVGLLRAESIIAAAALTSKLLVPIWQGTTRDQPGYEAMLAAGLPVTTDYASLVQALGKLIRQRSRQGQAQVVAATAIAPAARQLLQNIDGVSLSEPRVKALFAAAGITVPASRLLPPQDTGEDVTELRFPVVLKVASPDILHKSAVGGVAMVHAQDALPTAVRHMQGEIARRSPGAHIEGWLVEEAAGSGLDLLVGLKRDPRFGTLLTLAFGGTWANSLRGAVSVLLPLTPDSARAFAGRFFSDHIDAGALDVLVSFLCRVAALGEALGSRLDILEINPVRLFDGREPRAIALDGVLTLSSFEAGAGPDADPPILQERETHHAEERMPRIPLPDASNLTPEQRVAYDKVADGRTGPPKGPLRVALHSPELAERYHALGQLLRFDTSISLRHSELAILVTARQGSPFQWHMHRIVAEKAGLEQTIIEDILAQRRPAFASDADAAVHDFTLDLVQRGTVQDGPYQSALACLGARGIVELTALVGYYTMGAMMLNAHDVPLPEGAQPAFAGARPA